MLDKDIIKKNIETYKYLINNIKKKKTRPLTYTEKILFTHLSQKNESQPPNQLTRGLDYLNFSPDRIALQDATAQMAMLQFMHAGRDTVAVPSTVHCDHLIRAHQGAQSDLLKAVDENAGRDARATLRDGVQPAPRDRLPARLLRERQRREHG